MTTYYVGSGGNDANDGLSWANRKATLNAVEDIPITAGSTVYVGPGTYRELLTVDVNGSAGSVISYIGDYLGTNTDGTGGIVRITGSDNDQSATRANAITASDKDYRTFTGFVFDMCTGVICNLTTSCTYITFDKCSFGHSAISARHIYVGGNSQSNITISNCIFNTAGNTQGVIFDGTKDDCGHVISNSLFVDQGNTTSIGFYGAGNASVTFCVFSGGAGSYIYAGSLNGGQTTTVNNCLFVHGWGCLNAGTLGHITEDYNSFSSIATARTNVDTGAHSNTYPPLFDQRWFYQLINGGAGPSSVAQMVSMFDLASYSQLIGVAASASTGTDLRGTSAQSTTREWGALEYDSTLKIKGSAAGGGRIVIA